MSYRDVENCRNHLYKSSTEVEQNQYIISYFHEHSSSGAGSILFNVGGKEVCKRCWRLAYGVRNKRFANLLKKFDDGVLKIEHGRQGITQPMESTIRAISWMRIFFNKLGDKMPTKNCINLPSCLTKADVYGLAYDDLTEGNMSCPSPSTFNRLWSTEFSNVVIPKVRMHVSKTIKLTFLIIGKQVYHM